MVAMRTNLFATPSLSPRGYVLILVKDRRGMMGIYWIFFTRHKRFLDDVCSYGSFENIYAGLQLFMVDVRTNLFGVRNAKSTRGYDAGKDQRGLMGMDWIFFTRHKRFVGDICTYGSFGNIYAGLQLFMVDIRTNLFATPSLRVGTCVLMLRVSEAWWE
jgi:hypothetical protein